MILLALKIKKLNPTAGRNTIAMRETELKNVGSKMVTQSEVV
mgnify:FL=1